MDTHGAFPQTGCPHIPCPVSYPTVAAALAASEDILREVQFFPWGFFIDRTLGDQYGAGGIRSGAGGKRQLDVIHGDGFDDDVIAGAFVRREGRIIQPLQAIITPVVLQNAFGARWESADGHFIFDVGTFAPDATVTIVLVGRGGYAYRHEWTMPPSELAQLK
jgi:hypothetical protein